MDEKYQSYAIQKFQEGLEIQEERRRRFSRLFQESQKYIPQARERRQNYDC